MYVMVPNRQVWWPVTWMVPQDGGKTAEARVQFRFVLKSPDDLPDLIDRANAIDAEKGDSPGSVRKAELMAELVSDWKDVGDEDKKPVPFSSDALADFFALPGTFMAAINAYGRCMAGQEETRRKKLKAAARAWARPGARGGDRVDERVEGAAAEALAQHLARRKAGRSDEGLIEIPPDERDALAMFIALDSQWKWHPVAGVRTGLDYAAISPTAAMTHIRMTPGLFDDLRTMERAAMAEWARR